MNKPGYIFACALFALVCTLSACGVYAQTVVRGPYLQMGTSDGVTVRWRTDVPTDSLVLYGDSPGNLITSVNSSTLTTEHEVSVTNLDTDTRYYYSVGSSAGPFSGDSTFFFNTSPAVGVATPTRIWVIGDSGTARAGAFAVRDAYKSFAGEQTTDLWLMLGDNAYSDGTDRQYQRAVFDTYPELLRQTILWPTLGNHDAHTADSATESGPYYDIFSLPRNAEAGGLESFTEAYYSFDYGNIHFICLDSQESNRSLGGAMMTWLENDLMANDKEWLIAFWHYPPYSKGSHDSDKSRTLTAMRENAVSLLESYGVDLVLTGHSHSYERSFLLNGHYGRSSTLDASMILDGGDGREDGNGAYGKPGGAGIPNQGSVYAVAGSSAKTSSGPLNHPAMFISLKTLGSMVLDVNGNRLDAVFLDSTGSTQDYFTIAKTPDTTPPLISQATAANPGAVSVLFSEPVERTSAENLANYVFDQGVTINSAILSANQRTVTLTTSPLTIGVAYTLTVNSVVDLSFNPLAPNSQATVISLPLIVDVRVATAADDAEERATGKVRLNSTDLEFVFDGGGSQTVGMRFNGMAIPQSATIVDAYIQFQVDEVNTDATSLTIQGQDVDNAPTFTSASGSISSRARTVALVGWTPPPWTSRGAAGLDQRTPDIATVIQEIVNRPGWASGNSLVVIVTGTGERTAESFNGNSAAAPLLHVEYVTDSGTDQPPSVNAGPDQTTTLSNNANLDGTVIDDSLPNPLGMVTTTWTAESGPGTVTFGDPSAVDTTASFSVEGTYVLRLAADDSEFTAFDELTVTVNPTGSMVTLEVRVAANSDDAEERARGNVALNSSDLEFTRDQGGDQTVGMRFNSLTVPPGATIVTAYIQFKVDEVNTGATSLTIQGQDIDNPPTFTSAGGSISSRTRTTASIGWGPPPWTSRGAAGPDQQTPDIASVIQEIVDRPGWASGNSMVVIVTGTGERTAESFNGDAAGAPLLHVEYQ